MTTPSRRPASRPLGWAISLVVAAALLWYLFRDIDPRRILDTARNAAPAPFAAFLVVFAAGVGLRAARFWILLGRTTPYRVVLAITAVRNLFVDLLPARLGELSYVYLLTTRAGRPLEDGVATMALAFLLDLVALAPLVLAALLVVGGGEGLSPAVAVGASVVLALVGGSAVWFGGAASRMAATHSPRVLGDARGGPLAARLEAIGRRIDGAREERVLLPALALSFAVRLAKYGSAYLLVLSLLTPLGYSSGTLGVSKIFLGSVAAELAAALPVHGIGGFGTYEAAWALTLDELGYPREHAAIAGLLGHAVTQAVEYAAGGVALLWLYTRRPERRRHAPEGRGTA